MAQTSVSVDSVDVEVQAVRVNMRVRIPREIIGAVTEHLNTVRQELERLGCQVELDLDLQREDFTIKMKSSSLRDRVAGVWNG